mmetsp:Transcript_34632/g.78287  ORF Transcript_34632/g.78287 Transcript_34632/m.78287 type:complete len:163 (+) Transcript_34632:24-512(+)
MQVPSPTEKDILRTVKLVPLDGQGQLTSLGSIKHASAKCMPCLHWQAGHCWQGALCHRCHVGHPGNQLTRVRPSREARNRIRKRQRMVVEVASMSPELAYLLVPTGCSDLVGGSAGSLTGPDGESANQAGSSTSRDLPPHAPVRESEVDILEALMNGVVIRL